MTISQSTWIYDGLGNLYGPPFVTRCLLYRLYDIDCSVLLYHERNVTRRGLVEFAYQEIKEVHVHHLGSASVPLIELVGAPASKIALSKRSPAQSRVGQIMVRAERVYLKCKDMVMALPCLEWNRLSVDESIRSAYSIPALRAGAGYPFEHQICGSSYSIRSESVGPVEMTAAPLEANMCCWKVSVENLSSLEGYGLGESCKWKLIALNASKHWKVISEMHLEMPQ